MSRPQVPSSSAVGRAVEALLEATPVLVGVTRQAVEEVGGPVTVGQYRLLRVLAEVGSSPSAGLADLLGVAPSSITRFGDALEAERLIERHRRSPNRSIVTLEITTTGAALVDRVEAARHDRMAVLVSGLPGDTTEQLATSLELFLARADPSTLRSAGRTE